MSEAKAAPPWLVACITADASCARSAARSVTRVCAILGLIGVLAALPGELTNTGWGHIVLSATMLVPLAAAVMVARSASDERVASTAQRWLRRSEGRGWIRSVERSAARLFLRDEPMTPDARQRVARQLMWLTLASVAWAGIAWALVARAVGGAGLSELTVGEALALSPLLLLYVPVLVLATGWAEASAQMMGCGQRIARETDAEWCSLPFRHEGACAACCFARREGVHRWRTRFGDYCRLGTGHDDEHLYLCGHRSARYRCWRRSRPCPLPAHHDDDCRSLCSMPRCLEVDGHEGEHAPVRSQPVRRTSEDEAAHDDSEHERE